jgi:DNA-binding response OmpR family regulator
MPNILLAGNDFRLLGTRAAVLGKTGASVVCCSASETREIIRTEKFDLVVLCHTLSDQEATQIIDTVRRLWPQARTLRVVFDSARERPYKATELDATCSAEPSRLIRRATALLSALPNHHIEEAAGGAQRL